MNDKENILIEKKVAIIGCGAVTRLSYVPEFPRLPNIKVTFVYDTNSVAAAEIAKDFSAKLAEPKEILEKSDAVIIATPPSTHFELAQYYLQKVPIVICEKPFVGSKLQAQDLIQLAEKNGRSLYVAHFRRCFPNVQLARNIVSSGVLGEIVGLEIMEGGRFSWQTNSNYISLDPFGGVLYDTGSHTIDSALYSACLDNENVDVQVNSVNRDKDEPSHEISADLILITSSQQLQCKIILSRYQAVANLIRVIGKNATIEFSVGMDDRVILKGSKGTVVVSTKMVYKKLGDYFRLQYQHIFNGSSNSLFIASRFVNLVDILEKISQTKENH